MDSIVLDTSAALALLLQEPGREVFTARLLAGAWIGTVNLAEVHTVLVRRGMTPQDAWEDALATTPNIEQFTTEQAEIAGNLIMQTRSRGLSLGDRACLALAITLKAPVYTADRTWKDLKVGCPIHVIR